MADLDYSKLTDNQLLALKASGGDLSKLSNDDLMSIHSTLNPSLGRRAMSAVGDAASAVGDFAGRANEYKDTRLAGIVGGAVGLPRAAADATKWATDKLGLPDWVAKANPLTGPLVMAGDALPTGGDVRQGMLDMKKESMAKAGGQFTERNTHPVVDAGVEAMFSPLKAGGKYGPLANFGGGAGSETAGEVAHNIAPAFETPARILGALFGGGAGVGTGVAVSKATNAGRAAVQPFTAAGRDTLVGQTLNKVASDPTKALTNLESYQTGREAFPDAVPGFRIDAGKASRDPGLMAAAETAPQSMRGPIVQDNNQMVTQALDRAQQGLPDPTNAGAIIQNELGQTAEGLKGVRAMETGPLYDAARKSPTPVKPFPLMMYTADTIAANKGEPAKAMEKARSLLFTTDKNGRTIPDRSSRGMMATRDALGDMLGNQELGPYSRSLLMEMKSKVDDALNVVPQAKAANTRFADLSKNLDPYNPDLGDLNKVLGKVVERDQFNKGFTTPAEKVPSMMMKGGDLSAPMVQHLINASGGNPAVKQALASAYIDDFKAVASSKVAEGRAGEAMATANGATTWLQKHEAGAANVLTPDQLGALRDISRNLKNQAQTPPGRTGSPTFDRLATESLVGALISPRYAEAPFLHGLRKTLGLVYGGANEATMNRLYEVIQDPALTKALMRKATPANAMLAEPVLRQITAAAAVPASKEQP